MSPLRSKPSSVARAFFAIVMASAIWCASVQGQQAVTLLPGQAIKGCAIPKEFGRLVNYVAGEDAGIRGQVTSKSANGNLLAGQAIFEAETERFGG